MILMNPHMCIQMVFSWVPFLPQSSHVIQSLRCFLQDLCMLCGKMAFCLDSQTRTSKSH